MIRRLLIVFFLLAGPGVFPGTCLGDITVVKEVVITPKGVNVAANIGSVNSSPHVRMDSAKVDIKVGKPGDSPSAPVSLHVNAVFQLVNEADSPLKLTVGFPVSNSQYSSFELAWFRVVTDGAVREVFRRKSSYPRQLIHEYVSGKKGTENASPPADVDRESMALSGEQVMGRDTFHNLMVWEETFAPAQRKKIEVSYEIEVPLQENKVVSRKEQGNHKGIWPQEANNVPVEFVQTLKPGVYYFFDYYLTSGASWAGPIGVEEITLEFDPWWQDLDFHSTIGSNQLGWSNTTLYPGTPIVASYQVRDFEPTENIYFAVRPGPDNEERQKALQSGSTNKVWRPVQPIVPQ